MKENKINKNVYFNISIKRNNSNKHWSGWNFVNKSTICKGGTKSKLKVSC